LKKFLLVLTSCLVSLLLAEAVVRLLGAAPEVGTLERGRYRLSPNPRIGYEPIPHYEYRGDDLANFDFRGRSNSLGFRDREHPLAKPPGTLRLLVLGDSIAAGHRVARTEDAFPAQLETLLRRRGIAAEVLNFAVSGYNTEQEVETLRDKGLAFRPDLVLVAYCLNDRQKEVVSELVGQLLAAGKKGARPAPSGPSILQSSHLSRLVRYGVPGLAGRGQTAGDTATANAADTADALEDTVEPAFARLGELARAHRFRVLVAVFPRFRKLFDYGPWEGEHRAVATLAERHGFAHLDLLAAYRGPCWTGDLDDLAYDRWHPTERGHRCAAEALAGAVEALVRPGRPAASEPAP
jgi:lysophospholipase L1-like esterase